MSTHTSSNPDTLFQPIGAVASAIDTPNASQQPNSSTAESEPNNTNESSNPTSSVPAGDVMTLKSLCVNCEETGETKLLLTRIPFFRDVILMAFECEQCGYRNSEVQSAEIQEKGCRFTVTVTNDQDMNRQLVKSDRATVTLPELEFEIPPNTQKGVFTTIEGLLDRALENLTASQAARQSVDAAAADAVEAFVVRLRDLREGRRYPFTIILDDPSGNSFLENPFAPKRDPRMHVLYYTRTDAMNHALGCYAESAGTGVDEATGHLIGTADEESRPQVGRDSARTNASTLITSVSDVNSDRPNNAGDVVTGVTSTTTDVNGNHPNALTSSTVESHVSSSGPHASSSGLHASSSGPHASSSGPTPTENASSSLTSTAAVHTTASDDIIDTATFSGSSAHTMSTTGEQCIFPALPHDESGNIPSHFRKGGALITRDTARGTLTSRNRRAGVVHGSDGHTIESLIFDSSSTDAAKEVMRFPVNCYNCSAHGECRMCVTDVPHFKEVIIMSFLCDSCGWRNVEVKGGGATPALGSITELRYDPSLPDADRDLTRDVIKSDTCAMEIPEIELQLEAGSLGGMYTTVEGLLTAARNTLTESDPFAAGAGDSADTTRAAAFHTFVAKFDACIAGTVPFTLRLQDPLANSWIYSPTAPAPDPRLHHTAYTRTEEEDLHLGLLDMQTEFDPTGESYVRSAAKTEDIDNKNVNIAKENDSGNGATDNTSANGVVNSSND